MALRFANKIHCIVNNVMSQGLGMRMQAVLASSAPPKTRYPLNETDANTYVEKLKTRAFMRQQVDPNDPEVVRTFNVDLQARTRAPRDSVAPTGFGQGQRYLATKSSGNKGCPPADKGDKKKLDQKKKRKMDAKPEWAKSASCEAEDCGGEKKTVQCKPGGQADAKKCPKKEDDGCTKIKLVDCERTKEFNCANRQFIFKDCTKVLSPYPSFSEACYEPLPDMIHECKSCPWNADYNHPTFKGPMNKHAGMIGGKGDKGQKGQKRKFHTGPNRWVTLRFGEVGPDPKDIKAQELENKPRAVRPHYLMRRMMTDHYIKRQTISCPYKNVPKFTFKPLPEDQTTPRVVFRTDEMDEAHTESQIKKEEQRMEATLVRLENMILAKNRVRVTGTPQCNTKECDQPALKQKKCSKKIKSRVCPVDLLDRKPYKKYREGVRQRREKCKKQKGKAKRGKHGKHAAAGRDQDSINAMIMHQQSMSRGPLERPSM